MRKEILSFDVLTQLRLLNAHKSDERDPIDGVEIKRCCFFERKRCIHIIKYLI